ncbi:hypothetical protein ACQJBY_023600 [Aegilops geniculata]
MEGSGAAARILLQVRDAGLLGPHSRRRWRQWLGARRQPSRCYGAWWSALRPQMLLLHPHHQPKVSLLHLVLQRNSRRASCCLTSAPLVWRV